MLSPYDILFMGTLKYMVTNMRELDSEAGLVISFNGV